MLRALVRTITAILDDKKAAYSFLSMIGACVLHIYFAVTVKDALLLVSPLSLLTIAQTYVDAVTARQKSASSLAVPIPTPELGMPGAA